MNTNQVTERANCTAAASVHNDGKPAKTGVQGDENAKSTSDCGVSGRGDSGAVAGVGDTARAAVQGERSAVDAGPGLGVSAGDRAGLSASSAVTRSEETSSSPFMYGQVPITIERPAYAAPFVVARVGIGSNWHTAEGKTPERAAAWLRVRLAGLFAYGDTVQRGGNFRQALIAQGKAWRAQMMRERASGAAIHNCGGVGRKLVPPAAASSGARS